MEWINNIGTWFQENCGSFLMWLQTIDFAGLIATITLVIKQAIATRSNTSNVKKLETALKDNTKLMASLEALETKNKELTQIVESQNHKINELVDGVDKIMVKMNAALDVYSLVYQTIKNEDTRVAVNNILSNARYSETRTRQALTQEIEEMKATVAQLTEAATATVDNIVTHSKQLLNGDDTSIPRG